jgi:hypothetical protein
MQPNLGGQGIRARVASVSATVNCYRKAVINGHYMAFLKCPVYRAGLVGHSRIAAYLSA